MFRISFQPLNIPKSVNSLTKAHISIVLRTPCRLSGFFLHLCAAANYYPHFSLYPALLSPFYGPVACSSDYCHPCRISSYPFPLLCLFDPILVSNTLPFISLSTVMLRFRTIYVLFVDKIGSVVMLLRFPFSSTHFLRRYPRCASERGCTNSIADGTTSMLRTTPRCATFQVLCFPFGVWPSFRCRVWLFFPCLFRPSFRLRVRPSFPYRDRFSFPFRVGPSFPFLIQPIFPLHVRPSCPCRFRPSFPCLD